jgi:hypothetical protein
METIETLLLGAVAMGSLVVSLFFLRFWTRTRDVFFIYFSVAFFIEAVSHFALAFEPDPYGNEPLYYLPRLLAFSLIALAVVQKNRPGAR